MNQEKSSSLQQCWPGVFCAILLCSFLSACETVSGTAASLWPASLRVGTDQPILEQLNAAAAGDSHWFGPLEQRRDELESRYQSEHPRISPYLEGDIYLYSDEELNSYLHEITDLLLENFSGPKPDIVVVVETNTRFNAYVDELGQVHLSTGALRSLQNEDQLAGVLAHELSHFLLRHNLEKQASADISRVAGVVSTVGQQLILGQHAGLSRAEREKTASKLVLGSDSFGLLWADLLSPLWSRENEREADRLAIDLMKASDYNHEELMSAIALIHDAAASRSLRMEKVGDMASGFIEMGKQQTSGWSNVELGQLVGDTGGTLLSALTDKGMDKIAEASQSHDSKQERINSLKNYVNQMYNSYELPPEPRVDRFSALIGRDSQGGKLKQDLAAVETLIAVGKKNMNEARARLSDLQFQDSAQMQISTALAWMSMDVAARKFDEALIQLEQLSENENAPAEVFIKLAKLHASNSDYIKAELTLDRGAEKIGRRFRFLPTLIELYKAMGNTKASERTTLECAQYDDTQWVDTLGLLSGETLALADSYYNQCSARLGYDIKHRQQTENRQNLIDAASKGKAWLDSILGE